jgi:hypothetical protein
METVLLCDVETEYLLFSCILCFKGLSTTQILCSFDFHYPFWPVTHITFSYLYTFNITVSTCSASNTHISFRHLPVHFNITVLAVHQHTHTKFPNHNRKCSKIKLFRVFQRTLWRNINISFFVSLTDCKGIFIYSNDICDMLWCFLKSWH